MIYFAQIECPELSSRPIRIGCSHALKFRLSAIQTYSPWLLKLIGLVEGDIPDEHSIHCMLRQHVMIEGRRSWYAAHPDVLKLIEAVTAPGFDWNTTDIHPLRRRGGTDRYWTPSTLRARQKQDAIREGVNS